MKLKAILALSPIFLLVPPVANAQSSASGTLPGGYSYRCSFVAEGVVLGSLDGSPGTLSVTAGFYAGAETETGTGSVLVTAPQTGDTSSGCIFETQNGIYRIAITSN